MGLLERLGDAIGEQLDELERRPVHTPATAAVIEVPAKQGAKEPHYEIEWRGTHGTARSGQWYSSQHAAASLAAECGAHDVLYEVEK